MGMLNIAQALGAARADHYMESRLWPGQPEHPTSQWRSACEMAACTDSSNPAALQTSKHVEPDNSSAWQAHACMYPC